MSRKPSDIPPEVVAELNAGTRETANLAEGLAMDLTQLLHNVVPELPPDAVSFGPKDGITKRMATAGQLLWDTFADAGFERFAQHQSDTVRGWAAYALAANPHLALAERLARIRPLTADPHFAVREWVWLALRPHIAAEVETAIGLLAPWTADPSPNVRRFASESTRPRGVWCPHITLLKQQPELGLPILTPLRADPSTYVQDSVANWINDAAKGQPAWALSLCQQWQAESPGAATKRICKRGLRSLGK